MTDKDALLREAVADAIKTAWKSYVSGFGEPPHGTDNQINALARFMPLARITAALEGGKDGGWMPMVTAPLDGTEINLLIRHFEFWTVMKVNGREVAERDYQGVCKGKWIDHNGGGWTWHGLAGTQVGWQPLPPLPTGDRHDK